MPVPLKGHSMISLGYGQAILGGFSKDVAQKKIYHVECSNKNCMISILSQELSIPRGYFVAIPISDSMSGCISES